MTFALLLMLAATPDAGMPEWNKAVEAPVKTELYSRKPNIEKSTFGKVLPAFASPVAFVKSKHPAMNDWSPAQRATFDALVDLATQKKPDLADVTQGKMGHPLPHQRVSELNVKPNPRAKLERIRSNSVSCCDDDGGSVDLLKAYPARIQRDAEGRILAALLRNESFSASHRHTGGKVTEKNAQRHDDEWEVFTFDVDGRIAGYAKFYRSDHDMRLGPELELKVCSATWTGGVLTSVECFVSADDGDEFNFVTARQVWTKN